MPSITIKEDYILIEPREAEYWDIWESLVRLFGMQEWTYKDVIWNFNEGPHWITYNDLYKIKEFIIENYPKDIKPGKKVAIVASKGLLKAMATEYTKIASGFLVEFKVFSDLADAVKWITT